MTGPEFYRGQRQRWPAERDNLLRELWEQGLSARLCGIELGCTRNAVIGRAHRLGLPSRKPTGPNGGRQPRKRKHVLRRTISPHQFIWEIGEPPIEKVHEPLGPPVPFIETKLHHCRWIVGGEGIETLCCGVQHVEGYPYCRTHCRLAYRFSPTVSEAERTKRAIRHRKRQAALVLRRAA